MNILVLNGSPKGDKSLTIQTALYLEKRYQNHNFRFLNVSKQIKTLEKDFSKVLEEIDKANLIIFAYPVYTLLAPYQLHRFIEILWENNADLKDKYFAQIATSKHFFDVTALKFTQENILDLGGKYLGSLSADMEDLQSNKGRFEADCFFDKLMFDIANNIYSQRIFKKQPQNIKLYTQEIKNVSKENNKDIVLVTNVAEDDMNLKNMINDFKNASKYLVREINVREYPYSGGCLGCMGCTFTNKCIYKDGYDDFIRNEIFNADGIIFAFTIENHYTHSSMKCFDDRQFCNGHRTVNKGKVTGYIISGDYSNEKNIQTIIEARSNVGGMYFCGVAGDEGNPKTEIENLAKTVYFALENKLQQPSNFYGVGGSKIFRDLVYKMQGLMQADHKFYKKHGHYDFPQKSLGTIWGMKFLGLFLKSPRINKKIQGKMNEYICSPYTKIINTTKPKEVLC